MAKKESAKFAIEIRKDKLIGLGIALLSFIFLFVKMISVKAEMESFNISQSESTNIFGKGMFDTSFFYGFAKIFAILAIIVFIVYVAISITNVKDLIPQIKFDLDKIVPIAYFGLICGIVLFVLIGGFTAGGEEMDMLKAFGADVSFRPAIAWYFELIFGACGMIYTLCPSVVDKIKNIKVNVK